MDILDYVYKDTPKGYSVTDIMSNLTEGEILDMLNEIATDSFNEAIDLAAKEAKCKEVDKIYTDTCYDISIVKSIKTKIAEIDEDSILKLKKC